MDVEAIAHRLVALCREGKFESAQTELYAEDAASIEPAGLPPGAMGNAHGLAAIIEKGHQFQASLEAVHAASVSDPVVAGNWFSISMIMDATFKGRGRMKLEEICLYHVRSGKIVQEQFFYDMG
jgi:hypothetical protein